MPATWSHWRQAFLPAALRIERGSPEDALRLLELADLRALLARMAAASPGDAARGGAAQPPPAPQPDIKMATAICNMMLRLDRSAARATQQGAAEAERLQRNLSGLRSALESGGIVYKDLSGQEYDHGRRDFEPLGQAQPSPGLARPTIIQCESPAVFVQGRIAQKARGVVGVPQN